MADDLSVRQQELLTGSNGCVDRIGLNAFFALRVLAGRVPDLVAGAVWKVKRSARGAVTSLERRVELVSHYSFHHHRPERAVG